LDILTTILYQKKNRFANKQIVNKQMNLPVEQVQLFREFPWNRNTNVFVFQRKQIMKISLFMKQKRV